VKAAFTRAYNKESHLTPYATGAAPKKGQKRSADEDGEIYDSEPEDNGASEQGAEPSDEDDDALGRDTMIKVTPPSLPSLLHNVS